MNIMQPTSMTSQEVRDLYRSVHFDPQAELFNRFFEGQERVRELFSREEKIMFMQNLYHDMNIAFQEVIRQQKIEWQRTKEIWSR